MHGSSELPPRQTLLWILLPMIATAIGQRMYLHLVGVHHVYPFGYLIHHLFFGCGIVIVAAFVLAFGPSSGAALKLALAALGVGSAMVLDEIVYLVATQASDDDYISSKSLWGSIVFHGLAVTLLLVLYRRHREQD